MVKLLLIFSLFFFQITSTVVLANTSTITDKSPYQFENTKRVVALVEDAAKLVEQNGENAFKQFAINNSRWNNDTYYIFIYDIRGVNVFHPIEPSLVNKRLINFKDVDGRPLVKMIMDVAKLPGSKASDWVFYKWEDPNDPFFPKWKSSYIRKVIAPNNKVYLIGCGLYNMKTEKIFIERQVDKAAQLVIANDKLVENGLINKVPLFYYNINDTYILVSDAKGKRIFDPNFPSIQTNKDMFTILSKYNKDIENKLKNKIEKTDRVWISYLWPDSSGRLVRWMSYINKVQLANGTIYYVYTDYLPAMPIWMQQ